MSDVVGLMVLLTVLSAAASILVSLRDWLARRARFRVVLKQTHSEVVVEKSELSKPEVQTLLETLADDDPDAARRGEVR